MLEVFLFSFFFFSEVCLRFWIHLFMYLFILFRSLLTTWKEIQDTQYFRHSLEQLLSISASGAITPWTGSCTVWMEQRSSLILQPPSEHSGDRQAALGCYIISHLSEFPSPSLESQGHFAEGLESEIPPPCSVFMEDSAFFSIWDFGQSICLQSPVLFQYFTCTSVSVWSLR